MKVILLSDVRKVGKKDQILEVSDGYANNYLIKNKLAVPYSKRSKEILDKELDERQMQENANIAKYNEIKNKLENITLNFKVKTGSRDKVFGQVSTKQIVAKLKEKGFDIDKKNIILDSDIDVLGTHVVEIVLHKQVKFNINVVLSK